MNRMPLVYHARLTVRNANNGNAFATKAALSSVLHDLETAYSDPATSASQSKLLHVEMDRIGDLIAGSN